MPSTTFTTTSSSSSLPKTYKAVVISKPDQPLTVSTRELRAPSATEVLIKVLACGVCGTDLHISQGLLGTALFPRVPGHELVGDVVSVGSSVTRVSPGDRVGGAWHGGHDGTCRTCLRSQFQMCDNREVNGVNRDGGYAEYVILRAEAVVRVPRALQPAQAAPLMCAGVTVFNAMRKLQVEQGNLVAIQGVGGLGHLAIQYACKMGYRVVALSRGSSKREFALEMGAHEYIDTEKEDAAAALAKRGGAAIICVTAPNAKAISPLVNGLQPGGKLLVLAPVGSIDIDANALISKGSSVHGFSTGHALDVEEALQFALDHKVECIIEKFSLHEANEAMEKIKDGSIRFRGVLVMDQ